MEKSIVLSYETLFELLRIERSRTELQPLPASFTDELKKMIYLSLEEFKSESDEKERKKGEIQLKNILKIAKELYERREKKIVNLAIDKSIASSALVDFSRFQDNERELFNELFNVLEKHKVILSNNILQDVIQNEIESRGKISDVNRAQKKEKTEDNFAETSEIATGNLPTSVRSKRAISECAQEHTPHFSGVVLDKSINANDTMEKTISSSDVMRKVRFLSPVPSFLGPSLEEYGPFNEEDVAKLPAKIAKILIEKKRAEEVKD